MGPAGGEHGRGDVPQRTVRPVVVVVQPPTVDAPASVLQAQVQLNGRERRAGRPLAVERRAGVGQHDTLPLGIRTQPWPARVRDYLR